MHPNQAASSWLFVHAPPESPAAPAALWAALPSLDSAPMCPPLCPARFPDFCCPMRRCLLVSLPLPGSGCPTVTQPLLWARHVVLPNLTSSLLHTLQDAAPSRASWPGPGDLSPTLGTPHVVTCLPFPALPPLHRLRLPLGGLGMAEDRWGHRIFPGTPEARSQGHLPHRVTGSRDEWCPESVAQSTACSGWSADAATHPAEPRQRGRLPPRTCPLVSPAENWCDVVRTRPWYSQLWAEGTDDGGNWW